jgi:hypothetical protein
VLVKELRSVRALLSQANPTYHGWRVKAMKQVTAAIANWSATRAAG